MKVFVESSCQNVIYEAEILPKKNMHTQKLFKRQKYPPYFESETENEFRNEVPKETEHEEEEEERIVSLGSFETLFRQPELVQPESFKVNVENPTVLEYLSNMFDSEAKP